MKNIKKMLFFGGLLALNLTFLGITTEATAVLVDVAINPGAEWSVNKSYGRSRMRLCFASPSHEEINQGVAALAEVCRREFGLPRA